MKQKLLSTAMVFALLAVANAGTANAAGSDWTSTLHPYIGADYQLTHMDYNNDFSVGSGLALDGDKVLKDNLSGADIHVGVRPNTYWGAELGYFDTTTESKHIAAGASVGPGTVAAVPLTGKAHLQGATLDALGYLPVSKDVDLIGTTGLAWDNMKTSLGAAGDINKSEIDWRIGAGAQVNLMQNVNLRGLVRYQTADFKSVADNAWVYSLGVNYSF